MRFRWSVLSVVIASGLIGAMLGSGIPYGKAEEALPVEELRTFVEVYTRVKSDYVTPVTDKEITQHAIEGMLSGLDPHSSYLDADSFKELQIGTEGRFGGLGIEVTMENGLVKVVSPIEDTPAWRAGIKAGDLIIKIDDTSVQGMSLQDAVKRMRGAPGSKIKLTIIRQGEASPKEMVVVREEIRVKSVKSEIIEPGYVYIRLTSFQENTGAELAEAVTKFARNNGPLKGVLLDLRNNPGGLLQSAIDVSAVFLPENKLVVYTEGRLPESKMRLSTNNAELRRSPIYQQMPKNIKTAPLVLLINGGSASASEIVAGALQDHRRGIVLGVTSFGKGSVQTVFPLPDGAGIKLTTARYFTPKGRSIQAEGINPDIVVAEATVKVTEESKGIREADLTRHLAHTGKEAATTAQGPQKMTLVTEEDYQFKQAYSVLKSWQFISQLSQ
jgi:carboxyl-terminal processing protease